MISEADELSKQIEDVLNFLRLNHGELLRLSLLPEVDELVLDFGVARRDVAAQYDYLPAALIRAAAEVRMGIELSQYAVSDGS